MAKLDTIQNCATCRHCRGGCCVEKSNPAQGKPTGPADWCAAWKQPKGAKQHG